ncbi:hypothetical protein [Burkholderia anthina]|uniref:hypothetical protein n=1 Tax=Burkholderia anthina TaxID=179879 RepID=UPI001588C85A|nr:hypothetical protein [Burkholderia anthina]
MRVADVLRELGRPIAYYPFLSRYVGGVNAAVLFCQIFYWQDKATSDLGVHKTSAELEMETGLSYEEQRAARASLRDCGVLIETEKRIEHKIYFRIDEDALELILTSPPPQKKRAKRKSKDVDSRNGKSPSPEMGKVHSGKREKSTPGNGESPTPEVDNSQAPEWENPSPPSGNFPVRGLGEVHSVNEWVITTETTAAATRASCVVDNPAAAADEQDLASERPCREVELADLLVQLELARGKQLVIDPAKDRIHLLSWVGKSLTDQQLRDAHALAAAARTRDKDHRPTYVGFVATFVASAQTPQAVSGVSDGDWFMTAEGCDAKGAELNVPARKPDEPWQRYRVIVAAAARERRAIEFVLKDAVRFNASALYQFARTTFGDALMPVDDYAS